MQKIDPLLVDIFQCPNIFEFGALSGRADRRIERRIEIDEVDTLGIDPPQDRQVISGEDCGWFEVPTIYPPPEFLTCGSILSMIILVAAFDSRNRKNHGWFCIIIFYPAKHLMSKSGLFLSLALAHDHDRAYVLVGESAQVMGEAQSRFFWRSEARSVICRYIS